MVDYDVVVVGGGIAGSALAASLAPAGLGVLVLERLTEFRDRVRGEFMHPWGAAEMDRLDLTATLVAAGGNHNPSLVIYDEGQDPAAAAEVPLEMLVPGVGGSFHVGHPQASEALNVLAAERGATTQRGVSDVVVTAGSSPRVTYQLDGEQCDVTCRIVVGADGRQSTVRKGLGIEMAYEESAYLLGGLLVKGDGLPDLAVQGTEGDTYFLVFPRREGVTRLYVGCAPGPDTKGADRAGPFLERFRLDCLPYGNAIAGSEPVGPCAYLPGSDSWTDRPLAEGVVLIGDAAGWTDPLIGEGLSMAMRDARMVSEVLLGSDWSVGAFEPYCVERRERSRRLRLGGQVITELRCTFTPEGRARRDAFGADTFANPLTLEFMVSLFAGPETASAEAFAPENIDRMLSLS